jgi:hypothetical protein
MPRWHEPCPTVDRFDIVGRLVEANRQGTEETTGAVSSVHATSNLAFRFGVKLREATDNTRNPEFERQTGAWLLIGTSRRPPVILAGGLLLSLHLYPPKFVLL